MLRKYIRETVVAFVALATFTAAHAQYDLSWRTIDGGGAMFSTGGSFTLGGTIGQPDAGRVSGGAFSLSGGFWFAGSDSPCGSGCTGDLDHNCAVALSDLTILLSHFGEPSGASPDQGDLNGDGAVSLSDLTILLSHFGTICS